MHGRHAFGLLLLLTACSLPGFGQQLTRSASGFSIDGTVRDNTDQHGLENIRVDLMKSPGEVISTATTQADGAFEFTGVTNGQYVLEVKTPAYAPLLQSVQIDNSGRKGVSLLLSKPGNPSVLNMNNAVISAHQLSAPHKAQQEFDKGMDLLYGKSDFHAAIDQFQRAIKDFPKYYEAYALEGTAYQGLGDTAAAEAALRKSVDLSSGQYSEALFLLSALLSNTKQYEEAAKMARKSVEVDTISWQGPFELARALFGLKQFDEAEKSAIESRDEFPGNPDVYILLANIHIGRHDYPSLSKDLDSYLKVAPNGPDAAWVQKTQERLQAFLKRREGNPTRDEAREKSVSSDQDADETSPASPDSQGDSDSSTPAPDPSGLPSLPPPSQTNP